MTQSRHILSPALTFIAVLAASFFFFWGTASAACTVTTFYLYGFPFTYTTGDCSTTTASPTASLTATPDILFSSGASSSLSWGSTNATSCSGSNFSTGNKTSGSATVKPTQTTTYTVTCSGGGKTATASKTVNVTTSTTPDSNPGASLSGYGQLLWGGLTVSLPIAPTCNPPTLSSDKSSVIKGESAKLSWSLSLVTIGTVTSGPSVSISNVGSVSPKQTTAYSMSGDVSVAPTQTTTYTATCSVTGGTGGAFTSTKNSAPVTVTVLEPVNGSCSVSPVSITTGQSSTWTANPSGGDGTYTYSWSGTNGLSGTSKSVAKTYTSTGTKTASVNITSAGQSKSVSCSSSVAVAPSGPPLSGSCSAAPTNITTGQSSTWTANPTGGDGTYTYSWSGMEGLSGTSKSVVKTYTSTGTKTASVSITSAGQSKSVSCSSSVTVSPPPPTPPCSDGIDNDNDGLIDAADSGCPIPPLPPLPPTPLIENPTECTDGLDNNLINGIDAADPACETPSDNDEGAPPPAGVSLSVNRWLIISGQSVTLTWLAANVKNDSCTVSDTNNQSWGPYSAGSGAITSPPLTSETVFTLSCKDFNDSAVSDSKTVRLVPWYREI